MLKYDITYSLPQQHFIDLVFYVDHVKEKEIKIHLPTWRPGRYEIGNFAQNIQQVKVYNNLLQPLSFEKVSKDCWLIQTNSEENFMVSYRYYAATLNAGSTYLDESQLYINPVNCFMYLEGRVEEPIQIQFIIPANYHIATQLPKLSKHTLIAENFDQLADSPLIASASLQHLQYRAVSTDFHLWFQGNVVLHEQKIISDFIKFSTEEINLFGDCECKEYHFLIHVSDTAMYHGVEHLNSSVNAIGPGEKLMEEPLYNDFIGLCSHELFHLWNVKRIRPLSMLPYNFKEENYSSMGYVYEGITTYYGDLILLRAGVYNLEQYFKEVNIHLLKHFNNYGRYNQSLADSSMDTWLDGYLPGIPDRKVNIYTEGLLAALILDAHCIAQTEGEYCLDDILKLLYHDTYKKGVGYDESTWKACIESITGHRYDWYFKEIIHGCGFIEKYLDQALAIIGLQMTLSKTNMLENRFGIRGSSIDEKIIIAQLSPDSQAYNLGVAKDDMIIGVNSMPITTMGQLLAILDNADTVLLSISRNKKVYEYSLTEYGQYFMKREIQQDSKCTSQSKAYFEKWSRQNRIENSF